jgi:hypothetical protein
MINEMLVTSESLNRCGVSDRRMNGIMNGNSEATPHTTSIVAPT